MNFQIRTLYGFKVISDTGLLYKVSTTVLIYQSCHLHCWASLILLMLLLAVKCYTLSKICLVVNYAVFSSYRTPNFSNITR